MISTRILSPEEFDKLKDTPEFQYFTPENAIVVVAEDENGNVIGRMALMNLIHLEGSWVSESKRNGLVVHKLEEKLLETAKECGLQYVHTYAPSALHENLLFRAGWEKLPVTVWAKKVE